jgi:hypothetical protein
MERFWFVCWGDVHLLRHKAQGGLELRLEEGEAALLAAEVLHQVGALRGRRPGQPPPGLHALQRAAEGKTDAQPTIWCGNGE